MPKALATRNRIEPTKSGAHTSRSVWCTVSEVIVANAVLTLTASVPGN